MDTNKPYFFVCIFFACSFEICSKLLLLLRTRPQVLIITLKDQSIFPPTTPVVTAVRAAL